MQWEFIFTGVYFVILRWGISNPGGNSNLPKQVYLEMEVGSGREEGGIRWEVVGKAAR